MTALPYILQGKNIVVIVNNQPFTITETNINYAKLKEAIVAGDWDNVPDLVSPKKAIQAYIKGHLEFIEGVVYEEGVPVHNALTERIFSMYEDGFPIDPLLNLYKNIKANPSVDSAAELYGFLEKNSLPTTEDGCFIAYKRVNDNYTDCYSGTIDNSIGKVVTMERKLVNGDRDQTCSSGLHFCSHDYLQHFGGARIVLVKINPMDVVSIPSDYNNAKGRCCKYEVIGEVTDTSEKVDTISKVSVYQEIKHMDADEPDDFVEVYDETELYEVKRLGLRDQAKIWNILTGGSLKKFSYREDVDRRMYGEYSDADIINAASKLGLV